MPIEVVDAKWGEQYAERLAGHIQRTRESGVSIERVEVGPSIARWIKTPRTIDGVRVVAGPALEAEQVRFVGRRKDR